MQLNTRLLNVKLSFDKCLYSYNHCHNHIYDISISFPKIISCAFVMNSSYPLSPTSHWSAFSLKDGFLPKISCKWYFFCNLFVWLTSLSMLILKYIWHTSLHVSVVCILPHFVCLFAVYISLCVCPIICLSIYLLMDLGVVSSMGLLWVKLTWTFVYKFFCYCIFFSHWHLHTFYICMKYFIDIWEERDIHDVVMALLLLLFFSVSKDGVMLSFKYLACDIM